MGLDHMSVSKIGHTIDVEMKNKCSFYIDYVKKKKREIGRRRVDDN